MILNNNLKEVFSEINGLILIYGPAASGKSTLAMQSSLEVAKHGKVLFVDTEKSFSIDRIKLMEESYEELLKNIFIISIKDFNDQFDKLSNIERFVEAGKFDFVVVDSFGFFYRHGLHSGRYTEVNEKAITMLRNLKHLVKDGISVLITNQVYSSPKENEDIKVIGGNMIRNFSDSIIELGIEPRKLSILKPFEKEVNIDINNLGVFGL
jgi:RecA/RadA recombinase